MIGHQYSSRRIRTCTSIVHISKQRQLDCVFTPPPSDHSPAAGFAVLLVTAPKDLGFGSVLLDFDKLTNGSPPRAPKRSHTLIGGAIFPGDGFVSFTAQPARVYIREQALDNLKCVHSAATLGGRQDSRDV